MLRSLIFTLLTLVVATNFSYSQARNCESMNVLQQLQNNDPLLEQRMEAIERFTEDYVKQPSLQRAVVTIPVVFHIVYRTNTENISAAQIQSQLDVLNLDFRRQNLDADNTWAQAADSEIEFCLATVDPNGNATNGITRTPTNVNGFGTNDAMKFDSQGGKDAWPADKYMNFWVCNIGGGILGYAQFPGGPASTDGVVCDYRYTGTNGTATAPFNKGRTGTHEVGHYLNLRHIWGDGNCNQDDGVSDTPVSDASNGGCAAGHVSCGTVDMVQNYMDYSDDACMNLFTIGQKNRMQALFAPGGARNALANSTACGSTPPPPTCNDGQQNGDETGVDCGGSTCPACPSACNQITLSLALVLDNYPSETSWSIVNSNGGTVESGGGYSVANSTVNVDVCLPAGCYDFVINDTYGDGICCSYGNGSYTLTANGAVQASGGQFTNTETTNFCLGGGGPTPTCNDGQQNGDETGVDCGGSSCPACPTCNDGQQNGDETGVDCGGSTCPACPTCNDGQQNGDETGVDCGGSTCPACPTCNDGQQNGDETGVDCGGSCPACPTGCNGTEVRVAIVLDNYPGETTWSLVNAAGTTVSTGGPYSTPNSTVNVDVCLPNGCYDFVINDAYGDGICCSYGNGSYNLLDGGVILASGGQFTNTETTNFCVGGGGPPPPTCNDGQQNGDETGVDCGGSSCPACPTGGCTDIDYEGFESGWGIWNDGGSDSYRSTLNANSGSYSIRLRDNSGVGSSMTTDQLALAGNNQVTVDFSYYAVSMENGEDFWFDASTDNGATWFNIRNWVRGSDFNNNERKYDQIVVTGAFTDQTKLRLRCDASNNNDQVYFDDVSIEACVSNGNRSNSINLADLASMNEDARRPVNASTNVDNDLMGNIELFPNPTAGILNIRFEMNQPSGVEYSILDISGRVIKSEVGDYDQGTQFIKFDGSDLTPGCYFLKLTNGEQHFIEKFIVAQ